MIYITQYASPIGNLVLACKDECLLGLWIEDQKYYMSNLNEQIIEDDQIALFIKVKDWLDRYFRNEKPNIKEIPVAPIGSAFRQEVWNILCEIPYGQTMSYRDIASIIAQQRGIARISAQAVGGAVGHNPISIIIPCHRVIGVNGSLTGYAGGIEKKISLLKHENVNMEPLFIPKKGTAL